MMEKLEFVKGKKFFKIYLLTTAAALIATLFCNMIAVTAISALKTVAGIMTVIGFPLLFGQILLIFSNANRSDKLGRKLIRFNYVTIIVLCNCCIYLVIAGLLNSFYFNPASSTVLGQLLSTYFFAIGLSFGICLSIICYFTLPIETTWRF